jgi:hypothetical protein
MRALAVRLPGKYEEESLRFHDGFAPQTVDVAI